ncbi:hypothetical protein [Synechococcus sp. CS-1328]|uniref:hypothetical protein n=1 Tax=Synechococcus sp. CS-1328 TaxID=2847976 RepID=UPI00223B77E9|nr:hypothetical protein [Synechococcus sp. CS-1328]
MGSDRLRLDRGDYPLLSRQPMEMPPQLDRSALISTFLMQHDIHVVEPERDITGAEDKRVGDGSGRGTVRRRLRRVLNTRSGTLRRRGGAGPSATERMDALHSEAAERARARVSGSSTHWHQWALDHPDWPGFVEAYERSYAAKVEEVGRHNTAFREWLQSPAGRREVRAIQQHRQAYQRLHQPLGGQIQPRLVASIGQGRLLGLILLAGLGVLLAAGRLWWVAILVLLVVGLGWWGIAIRQRIDGRRGFRSAVPPADGPTHGEP